MTSRARLGSLRVGKAEFSRAQTLPSMDYYIRQKGSLLHFEVSVLSAIPWENILVAYTV